MKFAQTLFIIAAVLMSLNEAKYYSKPAYDTLNNVKTQMHAKHGYSLEKLIHPKTGKMDMLSARPHKAQEALKAAHEQRLATCEDEDACIYIENEEVGYDEPAAWWYGFVVGSQY